MEIILLVLNINRIFSAYNPKHQKMQLKKLIKLNNDELDQLGKQFVIDNLLRLFSLQKL